MGTYVENSVYTGSTDFILNWLMSYIARRFEDIMRTALLPSFKDVAKSKIKPGSLVYYLILTNLQYTYSLNVI